MMRINVFVGFLSVFISVTTSAAVVQFDPSKDCQIFKDNQQAFLIVYPAWAPASEPKIAEYIRLSYDYTHQTFYTLSIPFPLDEAGNLTSISICNTDVKPGATFFDHAMLQIDLDTIKKSLPSPLMPVDASISSQENLSADDFSGSPVNSNPQ